MNVKRLDKEKKERDWWRLGSYRDKFLEDGLKVLVAPVMEGIYGFLALYEFDINSMSILNVVRGMYSKLPARLPQGLDRPFVGVDSVEFRSEDPVRHGEYGRVSDMSIWKNRWLRNEEKLSCLL